MKRWQILFVALLLGTPLVFRKLEEDSGYVLVAFGNTSIEMTLWGSVLLLLSLFVILYLLLRLGATLFARNNIFSRWFSQQRSGRARDLTVRGVIDFTEGHWARAQKSLLRAAAKSDTAFVNYLMAAQAAHAMGDEEACNRLLGEADKSAFGATVAVNITKARLQVQNGQWEQALATINRVRRSAPQHPAVMSLLIDIHRQLGDWDGLHDLIPDIKRSRIMNREKLELFREEVDFNMLKSGVERVEKTGKPYDFLTTLWSRLPAMSQKDVRYVAQYANGLVRIGEQQKAETLLRTSLNREWSDELVALYGIVKGDEPGKQLIVAEGWLKERPNNSSLLLALARICLRNELWGKAREYYRLSLDLMPDAAGFAEYGQLVIHLGERDAGLEVMRKGLQTTAHPAELPMPVSAG
ncbi:MAG: tetratricopeptide repeat protein [Pseudomonadales bacterium]|nr:tetratricopeptide repeat protein [Pseudomonadales bacterium]